MRQNQDIIRDRIIDEEFVERIFEEWWNSTLNELHEWLKDGFKKCHKIVFGLVL